MVRHTVEPTQIGSRSRAHVVIPEDVLREIDALVGPRRRSEFLVEAAREKLDRERLREVSHRLAGTLKDKYIPEWDTPDAASEWVRSLRREGESRLSS